MQQFNQFRTYAEGENMPITEDGIPGMMARNGGLPMRNGGALSAAARKVQSAGFGEDKILVHINPAEYAELIRKHGPVTYNDETGLPQLGFFKSLGKVLKIAAPLILAVALPGLGTAIGAGLMGAGASAAAASALGGAILGAGTGFVTSGGKLKGAVMGGVAGGFGGYLQGASGMGGLNAKEFGDLTFSQQAMVGNRLPGFFNATDPSKAILARTASTVPYGFADDASAKFLGSKLMNPAAAAPESALGFMGKTPLTQSLLDPAMKGFAGAITSPLGIGASLLAVDALKKKGGSGANQGQTQFPTLPNQVSPGNYANAPNITAPTLQQMAAVPQSQDVQLPDGRIVPASYLQNGILNFTGQQNDYTQSSNPVFARTGGLAQVKRYEDGGTVTPAPFIPTRRVLTAPELQAQGMDFEHYGERPRPVGMQSFYTPYTTAPVAPVVTPTTPVVTPTTPVVDQTNYGEGDGTTDSTYGGRVPVGPTTTDQYGTTRDSQGTVFSANVDTSKYWDPTTGKYLGNWPGVDQYLREQEAARNPTAPPSTSEPGYFDPNYFDNAVGVKKGGALSQVSRYVSGDGDGQADKIPAMLSDGEYVMDAESVSALGNGSSKAGAKRLDEFRMNLRKHKRSAPVGKIPPKTKKLNKYMSGGSR
jgi:hypothetical protein